MLYNDEALASIVADVARGLTARRETLATAESCTGGWIAKLITDRAGSSACFLGGVVAYSDALKMELLGVPSELLAEHGAVSGPVVQAMAEGARRRCGANHAIAISGVAGPDGGTPGKAVGTVWIAWADRDRCISERNQFDGDRDAVRRAAVHQALARLARELDASGA